MKKNIFIFLCTLTSVLGYVSCSGDDATVVDPPLSNQNDIISFLFTINEVTTPLSFENREASILLPAFTDVTKLTPTIEISDKATVKPASGTPQDFTNPVTYTVTAENGDTKKFTIRVSLEDPSSDNKIHLFEFINLAGNITSNGYGFRGQDPSDIDTLSFKVPYLSPIEGLKSRISINETATIVPASGEELDYSTPVKYTVTAQNGETKDYLVMVDNSLDKIKIEGFHIDSFRDKKPGDLIQFDVNEVNPIQDRIQLYLVDMVTQSKIALPIQDIKEVDDTKYTITSQLPDTYTNSNYQIEISIEADNSDLSDGFRLDKGTPNFVHVKQEFNNGDSFTIKKLFSMEENGAVQVNDFTAQLYVEEARFDAYKFYLKQNGNEYSITSRGHDMHFPEAYFTMIQDLGTQGATDGSDYTFVIEIDGVKHEFPFINDQKNPIEVIIPGAPSITSTDKASYIKGEVITLQGENLYVDAEFSNIVPIDSNLSLFNISEPSIYYSLHATSTSSQQISFTTPATMQSGDPYRVGFRNNIGQSLPTSINVAIEQPASEHPSITITEAVLYYNASQPLHKQVRISFSENIETVSIDNLVLHVDQLEVGNYFTNPTSILTGQLSDDNASKATKYKDGYVIIDGYKIPFTLEIRS